MKKLLLLTFLLSGLATEVPPAEAAPCASTITARNPNHLDRTRRRLRRQAAMRVRHNKQRN